MSGACGTEEKSRVKAIKMISATLLAFGLSACSEESPSEYAVSMTLQVEQVPVFLTQLN